MIYLTNLFLTYQTVSLRIDSVYLIFYLEETGRI